MAAATGLLLLLMMTAMMTIDFGGCQNKLAGAAASHKGRGCSCVACHEHDPCAAPKQHKAWLLSRPPAEMLLELD